MQEEQLKDLVKELFDKYLNVVEESDSGYLFNPTTITTCRALRVVPLSNLLEKMRVLSGAGKNPLYESETNHE
jgi:hypothetical protein